MTRWVQWLWNSGLLSIWCFFMSVLCLFSDTTDYNTSLLWMVAGMLFVIQRDVAEMKGK